MTPTSFCFVLNLCYLCCTSTRHRAGCYADPAATVSIADEADYNVAIRPVTKAQAAVGNHGTSRDGVGNPSATERRDDCLRRGRQRDEPTDDRLLTLSTADGRSPARRRQRRLRRVGATATDHDEPSSYYELLLLLVQDVLGRARETAKGLNAEKTLTMGYHTQLNADAANFADEVLA